MDELSRMSVSGLLRLNSAVAEELRGRNVLRSSNNPVGDYSEWLFAKAFGWRLEPNSKASYDAVCAAGLRYQIKGRKWRTPASSHQLGAIRRLSDRSFDHLAVLLLDRDYRVDRAALIPFETVEARSRYSSHVNAWILSVRDSNWALPEIVDVTDRLRRVEDL